VRRVFGRVAAVVGVLWGAATLTFLAEHLMPSDPAKTILGGAGAKPSAEQLAAVNAQYGFDKPVLVQYLDYLGGLVRGDLGTSYVLYSRCPTSSASSWARP
jgi:peptide/nickel transport system permease protein